MTLSVTQYANLLPSYVKGIIEAYSTMSDPLVISGFIKRDNIEWTPYELDGGISCNRMPLFSGEVVTDGTRFNRAGFSRNVISEVTMGDRKFRTSYDGQPTFGAIDDPRRLARILNLSNPALADMTYLSNVIKGHAMAAYWDYLENFVSLIFKDCTIKTDYDNTTGPSGRTVTFENDVKYPAHKMVTDLIDTAVPAVDRASAILNELHITAAPMMKHIQGQPITVITNQSTFWALRSLIETYKYYQTHRRFNDDKVGGTFQFENSTVFTNGDFVFVGMPDNRFPTVTVDTESAFRCLIITPNALRIKVSQGDLTNAIGIFDSTLQSIGMGDAYNYAQDNFAEATFNKIQSYMPIEPHISSFMENGALGGNTIPNLLKVYTNTLPSGTDTNAEYPYTRAQYNIGVLRANPYGLREFQVKPSLIGYTVTP